MEEAKESQIPWMDEETFSSQSTSLPDILEESNQIGTIIIFVISAVLTITLLFVVAIFIDCRQQKLTKIQSIPRRKVLKLKIPRMGRPVREDEGTLADKMQQNEPSSSSMIV